MAVHERALRVTDTSAQTISLTPPRGIPCHVFTTEEIHPDLSQAKDTFLQCYKSLLFPLVSCHTCQDELQLHSIWNSHPVNVLGVKVFYYVFNWRNK